MGYVFHREAFVVVALCLAWYAVSSASNVVGKMVLTQFPFPITVTMVQLLSTVIYSAPTFAACGVRRTTEFSARYYMHVLIPLAFAKVLTTVFSQVSIWKVPVSYAHTVKATTPLWTAGLARLLHGTRLAARAQAALLLIAVGVCVASFTELRLDAYGLAAALAAAALLAAQHLYAKRVMRDTSVHHLRLLQILSLLALVLLSPAWVLLELPDAIVSLRSMAGRVTSGLAADGALAWLQAVCAFSVLSRVSPVAYGVASAAKRAAVVLVSLVVLQNPVSLLNVLGMALALGGVALYDHAKRDPPPLARPLLPV